MKRENMLELRSRCRCIGFVLLVLAVCSWPCLAMAGPVSEDDFENASIGALHQQTSGTGWATSWTAVAPSDSRNVSNVVAGKLVTWAGLDSTHINRRFNADIWAGPTIYAEFDYIIDVTTLQDDNNVYVGKGSGGNSVHFEFRANGDIRERGGGTVLGKWDGSDQRPELNLKSGWKRIKITINLSNQKYTLNIGGVTVGTDLSFRNTQSELDYIRFYRAKTGASDYTNGYIGIDNVYVSTVPRVDTEPLSEDDFENASIGALHQQTSGSGWPSSWTAVAPSDARNVSNVVAGKYVKWAGLDSTDIYRCFNASIWEGPTIYADFDYFIDVTSLEDDNNVYIGKGTGGNSVHFEFRANGDIRERGSGSVLGKWDGSDQRPELNLKNGWKRISLAIDLSNQKYSLSIGGVTIGTNLSFRTAESELDYIRFFRAKTGASDYTNGYIGIDNVYVSTVPRIADTEPPSVPTSVQATAQSETSINVTWTASTDNVGVAGYRVFRNGNQVGTSGTTSYLDTGLQPSTSYSYTVSAYDAAGNHSAQSSPPAVETTPADMTPPSVPTNVQADAQSPYEINVTWTASTDSVGVAGYKVFRNGSLVDTSGTTSYLDTGLEPETTYSYTVSAYDAAQNESAQSSPPATATTHIAIGPPFSEDDFENASLGVLHQQTSGTGWASDNQSAWSAVESGDLRNLADVVEGRFVKWAGLDGRHIHRCFNEDIWNGPTIYAEFDYIIDVTTLPDDNNVYIGKGSGGNSVHFEFRANGDIRERGGNTVLGKWDGTDQRPELNLKSGWKRIKVTINLPAQQYDLSIGGVTVGTNLPFRTTESELDYIRFYRAKTGASDYSKGYIGIDNVHISTARPVNPGTAWVQSHPFTTSALIYSDIPWNPSTYKACNFNSSHPWAIPRYPHGNPILVQSSQANGLMWHCNLNANTLTSAVINQVNNLSTPDQDNAWYVRDEPQAGEFPGIAEVMNWLKVNRPNSLIYLSTADTTDAYLDSLFSAFQPDALSVCLYVFLQGSTRLDWWWSNMSQTRNKTLAHGVPYFRWIQTFAGYAPDRHYRIPTEAEVRFQVYTTLAAGAKGLLFFIYDRDELSDFYYALTEIGGAPTAMYYQVQGITAEVNNLGTVLRFLHSDDLRYVRNGSNPVPSGLTNWSYGAGGNTLITNVQVDSGQSGSLKDGLIGLFSYDGPDPKYMGKQYFMLTNAYCGGSLNFTVTLDSSVTELHRLDRSTGQWVVVNPSNNKLHLNLPAGTGELFAFP